MTARMRGLVTLLAVVSLGMAAGCGGGRRAEVYEPLGRGERFVAGDLASLPRPDGAVALADPTIAGRTMTQSFRVLGSSTDETFGFYELHLSELGWEPQSAAEKAGNDGWRGGWILDGRQLDITVSPYEGNEANSQLDLVFTRPPAP